MKKGLLLLLAVFSMGMARAQVEVTDVSKLNYAVYLDSPKVMAGTEATIPVYLKSKWGVQGIQADWTFPENFIEIVIDGDDETPQIKAAGLNASRFDEENGGTVFSANSEKLIATILSKTGFYAGDDVIGNIKITVSPDIAPGEYPVVLTTKFAGILTDGSETVEDFWADEITCKIVVTDYIELFEDATKVPEAAEDVNVVVNRTIKGGEWSTICLPFAMDADQIAAAFGSAEVADFASWASESDDTYDVASIELQFESVDEMEANHPYIIKVASDIDQFRVDGVTIEPEDAPEYSVGRGKTKGTFYGTYTVTKVPEENLFLSGNKFWYSTGKTPIKGFRGYFELRDVLDAYYDATADVKINLSIDGTTAISNIDLTKSNNNIFNVNGIKMGNDMNRLNKGIYIVNGKKIVK